MVKQNMTTCLVQGMGSLILTILVSKLIPGVFRFSISPYADVFIMWAPVLMLLTDIIS